MSDRPLQDRPVETLRAGNIVVHFLDWEAPVRFAASELIRYLPRLLPGAELEVHLGRPDRALAAAGFPAMDPPAEGGILVRGDGRRYAVAGGGAGAVLHAAYALLESLGARWLRPGSGGEMVRPLRGPTPVLAIRSQPAFSRRGLADSCLSWWPPGASFDAWMEEMRAVVDWMGKMRMNRLFVHFNRLPPGDLTSLLPELERRGIALELGGHNLPKLLPPDIRGMEPGIHRMSRGVRRPDGNFCTANPLTLRLLAEGARRYWEQLPAVRVYHLWPYDASEDPWCSCPACRRLSPGEQMARAVSAAAEGLAAVRPGAAVSALLYHETLGGYQEVFDCSGDTPGDMPEGMSPGARPGRMPYAPTTLRPPSTTLERRQALFAPRERCYLHPIDGACRRNDGYLQHLGGALASWGEQLSALEYYGDPILLGRPANRPALVGSDLAAYQARGVAGIQSVCFGALSWWLYPVQLYAFGRGSWDPAAAESAVAEYCEAAAVGPAAETVLRYYEMEGEAAGTHLRFCGYGRDGSWATLPLPPEEPAEEARDHLAEMRRGETLLAEAGRLLDQLPGEQTAAGNLVASARTAHRMEEAFHRAVIALLNNDADHSLVGPPGDRERTKEAFATAAQAVAETHLEIRGVIGTHWLLPWLRRCSRGTVSHEPLPERSDE